MIGSHEIGKQITEELAMPVSMLGEFTTWKS